MIVDPNNIDLSSSTGWITMIAVTLAGLAVGGLHLKKLWRTEGTEARNVAREQTYLDGVAIRVKELEVKVENLLAEKTEAEKQAIRLEAEITLLRNRVAHLEEEKKQISELLRQVETKYAKVLSENDILRANLNELRLKFAVPADANSSVVRPEQNIPLRGLHG